MFIQTFTIQDLHEKVENIIKENHSSEKTAQWFNDYLFNRKISKVIVKMRSLNIEIATGQELIDLIGYTRKRRKKI